MWAAHLRAEQWEIPLRSPDLYVREVLARMPLIRVNVSMSSLFSSRNRSGSVLRCT